MTNAPEVFLQWKGTTACFDFWCTCGEGGHFDGEFAYVVQCAACGKRWRMPSTLALTEWVPDPYAEPVIVGDSGE